MSGEIQFIPDRLNEEPIIFLSMSETELKYSVLACVVFWVPVCLVIGWLLGNAVLGLAGSMAMTYLSMWLAGKRLRVLKRGKPKQYHALAITAWLEDHGLKRKTLIRRSMTWDIKRHQTRQSSESTP